MPITARVIKVARGISKGALPAYIGISALLLPAVSSAAESKGESAESVAAASSAKISPEQAKQVAIGAVPGAVTDATVEKKLGKMVYVIEIVAQNGGAETDVLVDMDSGKVLGVER
jgi:uncharacterized membrane protein YkoI